MLSKDVKTVKHDHYHSEIMKSSFAHHEEDRRIFKISWAVALYLVLGALWIPGFNFGEKVYKVDREDQVHRVVRKVLRPPVEVPIKKIVTKKTSARKVPMPDLTPNEPEPVIEPDEPEIPEVLPSEEWEIGIPDAPPTSTAEAALPRVGEIGVEAPIFTKKVIPDYPPLAERLRLTGFVILEAILRKDGSIDNIRVLRGVGEGKFGFENEAIEALKKWQFLPGKVNDRPADVEMTLKIDFHFVNGNTSS